MSVQHQIKCLSFPVTHVDSAPGPGALPRAAPSGVLWPVRYDPDRHHRRSVRLPEYDYSLGGSYFITICAHARKCLFGAVVDGEMRLSALGEIVGEEWKRSGDVRHELTMDAFVVMPNHVHGIVTITDETDAVGASGARPGRGAGAIAANRATAGRPYGPPRKSVSAFVAGFKSSATRRINALRGTQGALVWQRNYYEHIVRDEDDYNRIVAYIEDNPRRWADDEYNPGRMN